jgi:hypothetical protein
MPPPGDLSEVYQRFAENSKAKVTMEPEDIYTRPADRQGFGSILRVD